MPAIGLPAAPGLPLMGLFAAFQIIFLNEPWYPCPPPESPASKSRRFLMRNGEVSYWWQARGLTRPRPSLPGSAEADVCIVGAGYTGLWTAYYLSRADPGIRIIVLEANFAGFGASGRNGGWVTAALPGSRSRYAMHPRGREGVRALERQLRETVDEVARVCREEGIEAGLVKGGTLSVATTPAQDARLRQRLDQERSWGDDDSVVRYLDKTELAARLQVAQALGA